MQSYERIVEDLIEEEKIQEAIEQEKKELLEDLEKILEEYRNEPQAVS